MSKIFVTRQIPGKALDELKRAHQVEVYEGVGKIPRQELLEKVRDINALLCLLTETIDEAVFAAAGPSLKIVANYAVGCDNINLEAAKRHHVLVTNTPGRLGDAVAEFTVGLVLALSRRVVEADKFVRAGKYQDWDPNLFWGLDLTGKTLGVVGPGTIGAVVGKRLQAVFEMEVVYYCRNRKHEFEAATGARYVTLEELLKKADVVTIHVPLTDETKQMIGVKELALMKREAILVNTARGAVVEEAALAQALREKRIWGAALDVWEQGRAFDDLDNVILTPHIASATGEAREEMTRLAVSNIMAVLK